MNVVYLYNEALHTQAIVNFTLLKIGFMQCINNSVSTHIEYFNSFADINFKFNSLIMEGFIQYE